MTTYHINIEIDDTDFEITYSFYYDEIDIESVAIKVGIEKPDFISTEFIYLPETIVYHGFQCNQAVYSKILKAIKDD